MEQAHLRLWTELVPSLHRWEWRLICLGFGPGKKRWLRKAEDQVRALAHRKGATLIGDPIGYAKQREDGRIVVRAEALAIGPSDPTRAREYGPAGVDG